MIPLALMREISDVSYMEISDSEIAFLISAKTSMDRFKYLMILVRLKMAPLESVLLRFAFRAALSPCMIRSFFNRLTFTLTYCSSRMFWKA